MKLKSKALTLSVVLILVLSFFAGCSSIPAKIGTATKDGNTYDIPTSFYLYNAYLQHINLEYYASQNSTDISTMISQYDTSSLSYATKINDSLKDQATTFFVAIRRFEDLGLTLTADQKTAATDSYDTMVTNYGETTVTKLRTQLKMSETKFKEFLTESYKYTALFDKYFAAGGEYEIKDDSLVELFNSSYYRVKHILIKYPTDSSGNSITDTTDATYIEAKAKAEGILAQAKAGEDFVTLAAANSEDTSSVEDGEYTYSNGVVSESYGYTFASGSMDTDFYNKAVSMAVGDIDIVESTYGWHIMKKYDINEVADIYNALKDKLFSTKSEEKSGELCKEWAKDYEFTFNQDLLDKYSIVKLNDIYTASTAS